MTLLLTFHWARLMYRSKELPSWFWPAFSYLFTSLFCQTPDENHFFPLVFLCYFDLISSFSFEQLDQKSCIFLVIFRDDLQLYFVLVVFLWNRSTWNVIHQIDLHRIWGFWNLRFTSIVFILLIIMTKQMLISFIVDVSFLALLCSTGRHSSFL